MALSKEGRAFFLNQFNERLERTLRYPVQGRPGKSRNVKQRDVIQYEAHSLANALLGRNDLPRVVQTRVLWETDASATAIPDDEDEAEETQADGGQESTP